MSRNPCTQLSMTAEQSYLNYQLETEWSGRKAFTDSDLQQRQRHYQISLEREVLHSWRHVLRNSWPKLSQELQPLMYSSFRHFTSILQHLLSIYLTYSDTNLQLLGTANANLHLLYWPRVSSTHLCVLPDLCHIWDCSTSVVVRYKLIRTDIQDISRSKLLYNVFSQ